MQIKKKATNIVGGTPAPSAPKAKNEHVTSRKKTSKQNEQEVINNSEKENMTHKRGYNEIPPNVPVKSAKKKAE